MRKFTVGVIQLDSQNDKGANMKQVSAYIDEAASKGAKLVSLPEVMNLIGDNVGVGGGTEDIPGYSTEILIRKAKEHCIYIHSGSFGERIDGDIRYFNTSVIIDPRGEILATYRKLHTFDVTLPDGTQCAESERVRPGDEIVVCDTELGRMGMAICYDIRFPELFRLMALEGARVLFAPANFTLPTGKDHWEAILRTRAIENGCYVIAAGQIGKKVKFTAFGSSMVVDPWGTVIARSSEKPGVLLAEIDYDYQDDVRSRIPSLNNRRDDVYHLSYQGRGERL